MQGTDDGGFGGKDSFDYFSILRPFYRMAIDVFLKRQDMTVEEGSLTLDFWP